MTSTTSCTLRFILGLIIIRAATLMASENGNYSYALFARAIKEESTSPMFVLITLHDPATGTNRRISTAAPFLLGAIHTEHDIPYTDAGEKQAKQLALRNWNNVWMFAKSTALENVRPSYTSSDLTRMRERVAALNSSNLKAQLHLLSSEVPGMNRAHKRSLVDAAAHALLERGILVGQADRTGDLYLP
jgi:hypothetical protein